MGLVNNIINKMILESDKRDIDRQELFEACKNGYVSISTSVSKEQDEFGNFLNTQVIFSYKGKKNKSVVGIFYKDTLEIHYNMIVQSDKIYVTIDELIEHGAGVN
jgi:hypothetical protein